MITNLLALLKSIDLALFHAINGLCGHSPVLDRIALHLDDLMLKGLMFTATFGANWFQRTKLQTQRRETLILMLLAIVFSIIAARGLAYLLPFRERPMFAPDVGYRSSLIPIHLRLEDWSSFPSDNAAVVFAMTTGFWLLSRRWGLLWTCFGIMVITPRVYFGVHYPADVLVGALIGISVTVAINRGAMHKRIAAPILSLEQRAPSMFYGLLFPVLYEVGSLFPFLATVFHAIRRLPHLL